MNFKSNKSALIISVVALVVSFVMFLIATGVWFEASATADGGDRGFQERVAYFK